MNIIEAIRDEQLFRPFIGEDLESWQPWFVALRALYGLRIRRQESKDLLKLCAGRSAELIPQDGFKTALFLTGRRSGKSRISACVGAFEAALAGHEHRLARGERGIVPILAPVKAQAGIVHSYLRSIFETPLLRNEVIGETREGFDLKNGISVVVQSGDWRTVRGFTLICSVIDEAAFFGLSEESKVKSDTELIRAIKPGLATTNGRLVVISSPYARKGWCYSQFQRCFGNDSGSALVWNAPSRTMNPTLPQSVVDEAMAEDRASALSEYGGQFRDDVAEFLPRAVIQSAVVPGRREILPEIGRTYIGFADVSGGRGDDSALSIGHRDGRKVIVDFSKRYAPPHNPHEVIADMATQLRRYQLRRVTGDNYAADFVAEGFKSHGVWYQKSDKAKSALYLELLPRLCSGEIELLDDEVAIIQLANLERRTRSGGRDSIDHPNGCHDDVANTIAGLSAIVGTRRLSIGALPA